MLRLAERHTLARPLVNSGCLSVPCTYDHSPLNGVDDLAGGPDGARVGSPCKDAPIGDTFLFDQLGNDFVLMALNTEIPNALNIDGMELRTLSLKTSTITSDALAQRYLGSESQVVYLIRPDQHVAARWRHFDKVALRSAVLKACGKE